MSRISSDFRYNTGASQVPWAAVGGKLQSRRCDVYHQLSNARRRSGI